MARTVCFLLLSFPAVPHLPLPFWCNVNILAPHPLAASPKQRGAYSVLKVLTECGGTPPPSPFIPSSCPLLLLSRTPWQLAGGWVGAGCRVPCMWCSPVLARLVLPGSLCAPPAVRCLQLISRSVPLNFTAAQRPPRDLAGAPSDAFLTLHGSLPPFSP